MIETVLILSIFQLLIIAIIAYSIKMKKAIYLIKDNNYLSVVIPFKNEVNRILPLIESINKTAIKYKNHNLFNQLEFIFVDDHSSDNTVQFILDNVDIKCKVVRLDKTSGKKYAIKRGVELATNNNVLTLDADVEFGVNYLEKVSKLKCKGLTILPVSMNGKTFLSQLFSVEFSFLQFLTFGFASFNKYILCNGANLLFSKSMFLETLTDREDANISSGDDFFLLKSALKNNFNVNAIKSRELTVFTQAEHSFNKNMDQRLRWVKKALNIPVFLSISFIFGLNILFLYCIFLSFSNPIFLIPVFIKIVGEFIVLPKAKNIFTLIFHQFFYPYYLLVLLCLIPIKQVNWR